MRFISNIIDKLKWLVLRYTFNFTGLHIPPYYHLHIDCMFIHYLTTKCIVHFTRKYLLCKTIRISEGYLKKSQEHFTRSHSIVQKLFFAAFFLNILLAKQLWLILRDTASIINNSIKEHRSSSIFYIHG